MSSQSRRPAHTLLANVDFSCSSGYPGEFPKSTLARRRCSNLKFDVQAVNDEQKLLHHAPDEVKAKFNATYEVLEVLGQGSSSLVRRGKIRESDVDVALKMVRTSDPELQQIARAEFELVKNWDHPHIIKVYDFFVASCQTITVAELFSSATLEQAVSDAPSRRLGETTCKNLMFQLLDALDFLHQRRIIHRDIKPENLLVSKSMTTLKVIDFNVAKRLEEGGSLTMTGTAQYKAPEVLLGQSASECVDVWSAGLCLHYMLVGALPFYIEDFNNSLHAFGEHIVQHPVTLTEPVWNEVSEPCKAVLHQCMAVRMSARPAPMTLLQSEWLAGKDINRQRRKSRIAKFGSAPHAMHEVDRGQNTEKYATSPRHKFGSHVVGVDTGPDE